MTDEEREQMAVSFCLMLESTLPPFRHVPRVDVPEGCICDICEPKEKT